jgi:hypothetical protein
VQDAAQLVELGLDLVPERRGGAGGEPQPGDETEMS